MDYAQPQNDLRRVIGFWSGTAIVIGVTIGSGIFRTPSSIAQAMPNAPVILGMWALFGVVSLCGALAMAELTSLLPRTGGMYVYLREAYGEGAAFTYGWISLIAIPSAGGALSVFFGELLTALFAWPADWVRPIAVGTIAFLALANVLGVRLGTTIQNIFTAIKVAAVASIILAAVFLGRGRLANLGAQSPVTMVGIATTAAAVIWTYDGWISVSLVAGEVTAPEKYLKRMIVAGVLVIVGLYVLANFAYLYMLPLDAMAKEKVVATWVMGNIFGPVGSGAIAAGMMCSVFGALNGSILTRGRVTYAQARDGLTFGFLGHCHPKWGTPYAAIVTQQSMAIVLVLWLKNFDDLTKYFVVVEWTALMFTIGALFVLRHKSPDALRPFVTPAYPWVPLFFILGTGAGLSAIVREDILKDDFSSLIGLGAAVGGFPIYWVWRKIVPKPAAV